MVQVTQFEYDQRINLLDLMLQFIVMMLKNKRLPFLFPNEFSSAFLYNILTLFCLGQKMNLEKGYYVQGCLIFGQI